MSVDSWFGQVATKITGQGGQTQGFVPPPPPPTGYAGSWASKGKKAAPTAALGGVAPTAVDPLSGAGGNDGTGNSVGGPAASTGAEGSSADGTI